MNKSPAISRGFPLLMRVKSDKRADTGGSLALVTVSEIAEIRIKVRWFALKSHRQRAA